VKNLEVELKGEGAQNIPLPATVGFAACVFLCIQLGSVWCRAFSFLRFVFCGKTSTGHAEIINDGGGQIEN
jgi:hypothetical protein